MNQFFLQQFIGTLIHFQDNSEVLIKIIYKNTAVYTSWVILIFKIIKPFSGIERRNKIA